MNYNKAELCKDCKMPVEKITEEEQEGTIIMDLLDDIYRNRDI